MGYGIICIPNMSENTVIVMSSRKQEEGLKCDEMSSQADSYIPSLLVRKPSVHMLLGGLLA